MTASPGVLFAVGHFLDNSISFLLCACAVAGFRCCHRREGLSFLPVPLQLGSCAVGVQTSQGVVLGVERRVTSSLLIRERCVSCGGAALPSHSWVRLCSHEPVLGGCRLKTLLFSPHRPRSIEKIVEIDSHIGVAISGLTADATTLIDHARVEAQYHTFTYDEPIKVESLTQSVCDLKMRFGEGSDGDKSKPKMVRTIASFAGDISCRLH